MAKKKVIPKSYFASLEEVEYMKNCVKKDVAFCIEPCYNESSTYYIVRFKPSEYKKFGYLREDVSLPDDKSNRVKLNHFDATKKVYQLYTEYNKII